MSNIGEVVKTLTKTRIALGLGLALLNEGCATNNNQETNIISELQRTVPVVYPAAKTQRIASDYRDRYVNGQPRSSFSPINYSVDQEMPIGTEIVAAADGWAIAVVNDPVVGNRVKIDHPTRYFHKTKLPSGSEVSIPIPVMTTYGHLSEFKIPTTGATYVKRGQPIGLSGQTGMASIPVLDFATWYITGNTQNINPHLLWADGPGKMTCYDPNRKYQTDKLVLTLPTKCR